MSVVTLYPAVVASVLDAAVHGVLIDVCNVSIGEAGAMIDNQNGTAFGVVVRSHDKTIIGRTKTPDKAEKRFNDATGACVPLIVATTDDKAQADAIAAALLAFYKGEKPFAERFPTDVEAQRVLSLLAPVFGGERLDKNGWKCGTYAALQGEQTAAQLKAFAQIERAAKVLNNAKAIQTATGATGATAGADLMALVQSLLASVGAPASAEKVLSAAVQGV